MGMYDEYGKDRVQLKTGPCLMQHYEDGDEVFIPDGAHLGYEGIVIVKNSILVDVFEPTLFDKWGNIVDIESILDTKNPVVAALSKFKEEK